MDERKYYCRCECHKRGEFRCLQCHHPLIVDSIKGLIASAIIKHSEEEARKRAEQVKKFCEEINRIKAKNQEKDQ